LVQWSFVLCKHTPFLTQTRPPRFADAPWGAGPLLLTVGADWLSFAPTAEGTPVQSAVLHRVAIPDGYGRDRYSLPFLVNLRPTEK